MRTSKFSVKSFVAGALIMAIILSAGVAVAATERNISVIFRDIRLVVNGETITPRDVQGNIVEPFIWQGSTFLPVRAVGEALGMPVSWDGETSTVYVGAVPEDEPISEPVSAIDSVAITFAGIVVTNFVENVGDRIPLAVRIEPEAAGYEASIFWSSSAPNIVDIVPDDGFGLTATATHISRGMAVITVTVIEPDGTEHTARTTARTR